MRLLPKWIQDISKNVSANPSIRPMLAWVHVTNTHAWATNSFIAIRAELPKIQHVKFPWENVPVLPDDWIIIPAKLLEKIKFTKNKITPVLDNWVIRKLDDWNISIVVSDVETETQYTSRIITGKMPDLESFHKKITESEKKEEIAFSIEYMIDMLSTFKAMWYSNLRLSTHKEQWIVLKPYDTKEDTWWLVMPLKI